MYPTLKINSDKNPLVAILGENIIKTNWWSLLKSNWKYIKIRGLMFKENTKDDDLMKEAENLGIQKSKMNGSVSDESSDMLSSSSSDDDSDSSASESQDFINFAEGEAEDLIAIRRDLKLKKAKKNKQNNFYADFDSYSSEEFIKDLIAIFSFDMSPIEASAPKLYRDNLYFYDESLERNSHLYEQFILLAKGY